MRASSNVSLKELKLITLRWSGGKPGVPSGAAPLGWKPPFRTCELPYDFDHQADAAVLMRSLRAIVNVQPHACSITTCRCAHSSISGYDSRLQPQPCPRR